MKRRTKVLIYALAVVLAVAAAAVVVFITQSERIAEGVAAFVNARFGDDRNIKFEAADLGGSIFGDLRLRDVRITYTGSATPRVLLAADAVYARYSLVSFIKGAPSIDSIEVVSPRLMIPVMPDGRRVFPSGDSRPKPAAEPEQSGKPVRVTIRRIVARDISAVVEGTPEVSSPEGSKALVIKSNLIAASFSQRGDTSKIDLERADLAYGEAARIDRLSGVAWALRDRVEIKDIRMTGPATALAVSGAFGTGANKALCAEAVIDSLSVPEVSAFLGGARGTVEGNVKGRVRAEGKYDQMAVDLDLAANVSGWQVDSLIADAVFAQKMITVRHLSGIVNDSRLDLACDLVLGKIPQYRGSVSFAGLDISRFVTEDKRAYESNLTGRVSFEGRGFDKNHLSIAARPNLEKGRYREWGFDAVDGTVRITQSEVELDSVMASIGRTRVMTSGKIGMDGDLGLGFQIQCRDLADLASYHKAKNLKGEVSGMAELAVTDGRLVLTSKALGRGIDYGGAYMESLLVDFDLAQAEGALTGSADIRARTMNLRGFKAGALETDIAIEDSTIRIARLAVTRPTGDLLGAKGEVTLRKRGYKVAVDSLFVEMADAVWWNAGTVRVISSGDSLSVSSFDLTSGMGRLSFANSAFAAGRFRLAAKVEDFNLALLKEAIGQDIPTGTLALDLDAEGSSDALAFGLGFTVSGGEMRSVSFDSLSGGLTYDGSVLSIERIALDQNGSNVVVDGVIPVNLAPSRISALAGAGKANEILGDLGRVRIKASNMDIAVFSPLAPPLAKIRGIAELEVELAGQRDNPRITSMGTLAGMVYGHTSLGDVAWDLALEDSVLHVNDLNFSKPFENVSASGDIPAAVSVLPFASSFPRSPMDLAVKAENANLDVLCEVLPKLKVCSGVYNCDLAIGGTLDDPTFTGPFSLAGARLRFEGLAEAIDDIYVKGEAGGKRFSITSMTAEEGTVTAQGFVALDGVKVSDWDFAVKMNDLAVTEFEEFYVVLTGDLSVKAERIEKAGVIPNIEGSITVEEGEYYVSLGGGAGGTGGGSAGGGLGAEPTPTWLMDLAVTMPNDFWIRGKDIDAELQGDLNVRKGAAGLTVLGALKTLRGTFSVGNNDFRITTGEFRFNDVKSVSNAYIDLVATSRVIDEEIEITAKGNIDTLDIAATSESGWSETDIFKALTLRRGSDGQGDSGGNLFSDALLRSWGLALANRFGGDVARDLGLDEFGIEVAEPGQGDALPATRVTIGKYVSPKIYLKYSQSLERLYGSPASQSSQEGVSFPEGQLNVEYRLSDKVSVAGETGMAGGFAYFDVDLKFTFGY